LVSIWRETKLFNIYKNGTRLRQK